MLILKHIEFAILQIGILPYSDHQKIQQLFSHLVK